MSVATYAALRRQVEETLLLGQRKIEQAKVETYWRKQAGFCKSADLEEVRKCNDPISQ